MEVDETEANQDLMSPYEYEDDMGPRDSAPPTPMRSKRRWEVDYESEDNVQWGDLYKRYEGESKAYVMPEDPNEIVHPGTRPRARKVTLARDDSDDDDDEEEQIGDEREAEVIREANNLNERQYKNFMRDLDYEKMNDVINGVAYHTMDKIQSVRPSTKYVNDPKDHPADHPYKPILYHKVIEKRLRVRSINETGLALARSHLEEMRRFTRVDRARYKMVIIQMLDNLDFMCAPYHHKKIQTGNPIKTVKKYIKDFFH